MVLQLFLLISSAFCYNPGTASQCPHDPVCPSSSAVTSLTASQYCGCEDTSLSVQIDVANIPSYAFYNSKLNSITFTTNVVSIGTGAFDSCEISGSVTFDPQPTSSTSTLAIADGAFYHLQMTDPSETFSLPSHLSSVGESAFDSDYVHNIPISFPIPTKLQTIGNYAFRRINCKSSISFADSMTSIGSYAFASASTESYSYITLPEKLENIGEYAFSNCQCTINFDEDQVLKTVGSGAFSYTTLSTSYDHPLPLSPDTTIINSESFSNLGSPIYLPDLTKFTKLEEIAYGAFMDTAFNYYPYDQRYIKLPSSLKRVGAYAFSNQQSPSNFDLSETELENVGDSAFEKQKIISNFALSENLLSVGDSAFAPANGDDSEITLKGCNHLVRIGDDPFGTCGPVYDENNDKIKGQCDSSSLTRHVYVPESITFPQGLYYIGDRAFTKTDLKSVTFNTESQLSYIGQSAFEFLTELTVTNPINVEEVAIYAFRGCASMNTQIHILGSGTIDDFAFYDCYQLQGPLTIDVHKTPEEDEDPDYSTIGAHAFENTAIQRLNLPHLESIGAEAFKDCVSLTTINPNVLDVETISASAFENDDKLLIGNITAKAIDDYSFAKCTALNADVYILSTGNIGGHAFEKCSALKTLTLLPPADLTDRDIPQSIGDYAFYQSGLRGTLVIPETVATITDHAFADCNLQTVTFSPNPMKPHVINQYAFYRSGISTDLIIPASVKSIEDKAFAHCTFRQVTIEGIYDDHQEESSKQKTLIKDDAFYSCPNLQTLSFGKGEISFNSKSFRGCKLTSIRLGNITSIPEDAFYGMSTLNTEIAIPDSVTSIGARAFSQCSLIPAITFGPRSELEEIGANAFYRCTALSRTSIPEGVETIDEKTYYQCTSLPLLTIPSTVTEIKDKAFYGCIGFVGQLVFPGELKTIGVSAFQGCTELTGSLDFPETVETIDDKAFMGCIKLNDGISIGRSITKIGEYAFRDCSELSGSLHISDYLDGTLTINEGAFYGCSKLTGDLIIPDGTTFTNNYQFRGCSGFNGQLILPESVTTIPKGAFYDCSGLTGQIPTQLLTTINDYAFYGCSGFTGDLDLQNAGTTIKKYAFYNCRGLNGQLLLADSVTTINEYAFYGCSGLHGTLDASSIETVEKHAFEGCSGLSGPLLFTESLEKIEEFAFADCSGFSDRLSFHVGELYIGHSAFKGCSGFKDGDLTFTIETKEEKDEFYSQQNRFSPYYRYEYFLKIENKAFKDTKFKNIYYLGRFEPDCDYDIGISQIKGIHTSSNYANKTFCNYPLHSSKLSGGAIAGIVIACIVVVAVIVFLIVYFILKNKRNKDQSEAEVEMNQDP